MIFGGSLPDLFNIQGQSDGGNYQCLCISQQFSESNRQIMKIIKQSKKLLVLFIHYILLHNVIVNTILRLCVLSLFHLS